MNFFEALLEKYLAIKQNMNIVQIGANDGKINDPVFQFVMDHKSVIRILLIEPQPEIIPYLKENYARHEFATVYNGAIGQGESLVLYRVKPALWDSYNPPYLKDAPAYRVPSGFTSSSAQHVYRHAQGNILVDVPLDSCIEEIKVSCMTLKSLISELSWGFDIDVLQIDTEGSDDEMIYSSDIPFLKPKIINYENMHLTKDRKQGVEAFLMKAGYEIIHWNGTDTIALLRGALRFGKAR